MIPVVLSGGSGTRLWPVSRAACPKQFAELFDEPLLAKTFRRLAPLGSPWTVAVAQHRFLLERVLAEQGIPRQQAIYEPRACNTAPAVALLCQVFRLRGWGEEVVGIFPADHLVREEEDFLAVCRLAEACAQEGLVATLGIRPRSAATGFGYIEVAGEAVAEAGGFSALTVRSFREKPDPAAARRFVARGNFLWNAGMFVFRVSDMVGHLERLAPDLWQPIGALSADLGNLAEVYSRLPARSLDHAVMEHLAEQVSIPCDLGWSDVGSWDEVARLAARRATVFEQDAADNFVFPHRDKVYGLVGVEDLLVVDTADALLVARRGASQGVKELVDQLRAAGRLEATTHPWEKRPWGGFEVLRDTDRFKSKILCVDPGHQLSYQSHRHRSEHWVIVRGRPEVVLDGEVLRPEPGEAVFVPQGTKHRIRNPTAEVVELVEVQIGSYFGEDDIVRYEDDYDRA
jgi:mannose-1-phosphate guanylyltransferase/mannose-1-phosphate guanylyltransferase/mannose-6-phosphate isomerase